MATHLPPELWTKVFRFATLPEPTGLQSTLCSRNDVRILDILPDGSASVEPYAQFRTKRALSLVNRLFNDFSKEFMFEALFIPDEITAGYLADMVEDFERHPGLRSRVRQIVVATPSRFSSAACHGLTAAVIRIISQLSRLEVFYLRWKTPRSCEEQIMDALPPSIKHFEWHNPGGGFSNSPKRSLSQLLRDMKSKLEVLHVSGYLPLPGPSNRADTYDGDKCEFPSLKQLSVNREFYCDLHLISTWITSNNLTCLSLGTFWSYPKLRDPQCSFFKTPLPSLQCLHLGKSARTSPKLIRTIMGSATRLRCMEYTFTGDLDVDDWEDIEHHYLRKVEIHLHHPWDLRAVGEHLRSFAVTEPPYERGRPVQFRSLDCLKFVSASTKGGKNDNYSNLKTSVRLAMSSATSVALEFHDGAINV